jgi:hypothetical protein
MITEITIQETLTVPVWLSNNLQFCVSHTDTPNRLPMLIPDAEAADK